MVSPTVSLIVKQMLEHHAAIKNEILHGKISLRSETSKYQLCYETLCNKGREDVHFNQVILGV